MHFWNTYIFEIHTFVQLKQNSFDKGRTGPIIMHGHPPWINTIAFSDMRMRKKFSFSIDQHPNTRTFKYKHFFLKSIRKPLRLLRKTVP